MSGPSPFGALLRRHRAAAGLSQETLAERADVGVNTIADLESGRHRAAHPATAAALAHGLGLALTQARAFDEAATAGRRRGPRPPARGRPPVPPPAGRAGGRAPGGLPWAAHPRHRPGRAAGARGAGAAG